MSVSAVWVESVLREEVSESPPDKSAYRHVDRFPVDDNPVYKVVGVVKRHLWFFEPGAGSRAPAKRAFIARPLTPRMARHHGLQTKRSFVLARIPFAI